LQRKQVDTVLLEIEIHPVDLAVALDHFPGEVFIFLLEGVESHAKAFHDDFTHVEHILTELRELLLVGFSGHDARTCPGEDIACAHWPTSGDLATLGFVCTAVESVDDCEWSAHLPPEVLPPCEWLCVRFTTPITT